MANPLKAAYAAACSGTALPKAAVPAPVSTGAPAVVAPPAAGAKRDIAALRAKLAGGATGGVNPPEAAAALTDNALDQRTVETESGGAAAAPGWVEAKNGLVVRAPAEPESAEPVSTTVPVASAELTRGQKAAATRAANKAAAQIQTTVFPPASTDAPAAAVVPSAGVSDLARIADALEQIVFYLARKDAVAR